MPSIPAFNKRLSRGTILWCLIEIRVSGGVLVGKMAMMLTIPFFFLFFRDLPIYSHASAIRWAVSSGLKVCGLSISLWFIDRFKIPEHGAILSIVYLLYRMHQQMLTRIPIAETRYSA